jgi:tRNA G18 (ribose-2'-O)-methylase SpoU
MKKSSQENEIHLLLHDIRSAHNVGSMFRTADALGVLQIYCSGFTPTPIDRFLRPVKEIAKTALGAEKTIPWEKRDDPLDVMMTLKKKGFTVVGIEQDSRAILYNTYVPAKKMLVVVGSEVEGLSSQLRDACDVLLEIPMRGEKESLNVSVAFGVALFRIVDR